jgi:hypothetical protein
VADVKCRGLAREIRTAIEDPHEEHTVTAQKKALSRLSREFGLTPWGDPEAHLARLQDRWAARIEIDE